MNQPNKSVVSELRRLAKASGGVLNPEAVVESARNTNSPLHSRFNWDDSRAAHLWRIHEARNLIRVCVHVIKGTDIEERIWVSLKQDRNELGGYRPMVEVLSDSTLRNQLLEEAFEEMEIFQQKYARLKELSEIFKAFRKAKRR